LYVLDAEFFFRQASAAVQFLSETRYIRDHPIPEMVVVGVVNQDRNRDFTPTHAPIQGPLRFPTSGDADRFIDFLKDEVFPLIDARYRTQPYRIVAGWSLGGLFAVDTYMRRSDAFSAYLAISPSLWWDEDKGLAQLECALQAGVLTVKPLVVTLGTEEGGDMDRSVRNGIKPLLGNARDADITFEYVEVPGEGHTYVFYKAMLDGLRAMYRSWAMPDSVSDAGMAAVAEYYQDLSIRHGYPVQIPENAYFRVRVALVQQGDAEAALEVAHRAVAEYPAESRARAGLGWTFLQVGDSASAIASYEQAVEQEEAMPEPDSELLLSYRQRLADLRQ
jgi:predicted alpha/beta superfamily hydrolase